uniref:Putative polyprotein n=1 Tax=Ixodes scapularis TaxID=6945 RepID=A0A4D5RBP7_IXOSC
MAGSHPATAGLLPRGVSVFLLPLPRQHASHLAPVVRGASLPLLRRDASGPFLLSRRVESATAGNGELPPDRSSVRAHATLPPGRVVSFATTVVFFCGRRSHPRDECPASGATCFSCGREGHFANVCRSRPRHDRDHRQLTLPAGRRASARGYYEHRQARPGPTRIQGITFPDYELPATIYTVAPPDDFPERCRFCGGPCHPRKFCPAAHRRCFSCQKQGHLDRVCESRPRWPRLDRGGPSNPPTVFASAHRRHPAPPEPPVPVLGPASPDTTNPDPEGPRPASSQSPEAPPSPQEGPVPARSPPPVPEGPAEPKPFPRPEPPEPLGPDKPTPRQESRKRSSRRLPGRFKSYVLTLKELLG